MAARKNMIIIVGSKNNKTTTWSRWYIVEDSLTLPLKTKFIAELYAQTKSILELMSTSNAKGT
jgi:hypothetical protein